MIKELFKLFLWHLGAYLILIEFPQNYKNGRKWRKYLMTNAVNHVHLAREYSFCEEGYQSCICESRRWTALLWKTLEQSFKAHCRKEDFSMNTIQQITDKLLAQDFFLINIIFLLNLLEFHTCIQYILQLYLQLLIILTTSTPSIVLSFVLFPFYNPWTPICAMHMHMGMGPFTYLLSR